MYSYEDRIRAVRLYIKLGKRLAATIRRLGYPTKNSLKSWHREYEQCHDVRSGYVRSRPKYSLEQKKVAVDHYLNHDCCAAETLRALGYPGRGTLVAWIEELCPGTVKRIVGKAGCVPKSWEVKQAAVIELCTREESARVVAQTIGVSRPTLYNWKNKLLGREVPASMKRHNDSPQAPESAELQRQVESLRREIRQLQLEHDILKKANELVKKDLGVDPQLLTNREKTVLVDALKQTYTLPELFAGLGLARSSYFYHRARLRVSDKFADVRRTITSIFELNHRCYGYRRIRAALGRQQVFISEKVVQRLMK